MKTKNKFVNYILDLLNPYGNITAKAMFGGYGLYKDNTIFGIIVYDELYFKTDSQSAEIYRESSSKPFTYKTTNKTVQMPYWLVPPHILEDDDQLGEWLNRAWQISLNNKKTY